MRTGKTFVANTLRIAKDLVGASKVLGPRDCGFTARQHGHALSGWCTDIADGLSAAVEKA